MLPPSLFLLVILRAPDGPQCYRCL